MKARALGLFLALALAASAHAQPTASGKQDLAATGGGGGGITNGAGANVIPKSDGTNLVATALSEASAGAIATTAGTALGLTATAPAATTGASQAGKNVTITASPAVASTDTNGPAAGGSITLATGAGARLVSGDGNGGDIIIPVAAGVGTGRAGQIISDVANNIGVRISPASGIGLGLYLRSTGGWNMSLSSGGVTVGSTGSIGFSSGITESYTNDTFFRRRAAQNPAWGAAAASPVAYTHSLAADARAGTDSNTRGAKATLLPGVGTGTGGSGDFVLQTAPPAATGTAANTPTDRIVLASKPVALTESSATAVLDYSVASGTVAGGNLAYTIRANDATDFQAIRGRVDWSAVNKGGTLTATLGTPVEVTSVSSGTLTNTATITTGTNSITINLNAVSSLTQTTLIAYVSAEIDGTGVATTK